MIEPGPEFFMFEHDNEFLIENLGDFLNCIYS